MSNKKQKKRKLNIPRIIMLATGLVLALLIGIFALILNGVKSKLTEQTVAQRWSSKGDYAQNTIFFSSLRNHEVL